MSIKPNTTKLQDILTAVGNLPEHSEGYDIVQTVDGDNCSIAITTHEEGHEFILQNKNMNLGSATPEPIVADSGYDGLGTVTPVIDTTVIKPENIKKDVNILGVTGTHEGGSSILNHVTLLSTLIGSSLFHEIYTNVPLFFDDTLDGAEYVGTLHDGDSPISFTTTTGLIAVKYRGERTELKNVTGLYHPIDDYTSGYRIYIVGDNFQATISSSGID